jgi:ferritin
MSLPVGRSVCGELYVEGREEDTVLGKAVEDAMNEQIRNELFSAYQYLSMAAYCESENLPGFAQWMRAQAREETEHAMKS